ncbi:MAG: ATP-NAD kinase family protein [Rhodospirillaceae bacterium]|nr:ATP-NAD kinase family protein [Rhodospirillaceae bacterium]
MAAFRLGLIVNPIAGMGGAVGLKGSDTAEIVARARELGAIPKAPARATEALGAIGAADMTLTLVTAAGDMGEREARDAGFAPQVLGIAKEADTIAADTVRAAEEMAGLPVDLILFAGGDGTARDMVRAVGGKIPVVGIPAGVKMHSAVYATNPQSAARMVLRYMRGGISLRELEVMDIDEAAFREGAVSAQLYGYLSVPYLPDLVQGTKAGGVSSDRTALAGIAARIVAEMVPGRLYILGPGTTMRAIADELGIEKTLLGVDLVRDGVRLAGDAGEHDILKYLGGEGSIIVTPIGGQGHFFGRGNQQISAEVITRVGLENITVAATMEKIASLRDSLLHVDTGDRALDGELLGWRRVITGFQTESICRVAT